MNSCDKWLSSFYGKIPFEDYSLLDRAARTLLANVLAPSEGKLLPWHPWRGITPSQLGFRGVWNWDSAFHALGVSRWDAALGREQILLFLDRMLPSGALPDVIFEDGNSVDDYGKPPVMAWAAAMVERRDPDEAFLRRVYPAFVVHEAYWRRERGGDKNGLFNYDSAHPDPEISLSHAKCESGWDNSVRWDGGVNNLWPVDLNCYMVLFYRAFSSMAARLELHDDVRRWDDAGKALAERINSRLWCREEKAYLDFDFQGQAFVNALSPASFMPLFVGIASREQAARMAEIAASEDKFSPGWPTVAYDHPQFDPTSYWRGRSWLNVAYFALKGLKDYGFDKVADAGRSTLLGWVRGEPSQIFENYHPKTGEPLGVRQFSWSAVFTLEFLLNWDAGQPHAVSLADQDSPRLKGELSD